MSRDSIYVTRPLLPPLEEFTPYLQRIWDSQWLTNGGPLHRELEQALVGYLGVEHLALTSSGTSALLLALRTLDIRGEVITTPYSFVATAHALLWHGATPVFIDVVPETLNLDPAAIEAAITPRTTAILAVHCYGTPCDTNAIQAIAERHGLRVVYDAAHAFGVEDGGGSILRHGDLSILSFHATKVFNTFEGGAIVCPDAETKNRIDQLKDFGFMDEVTVEAIGINGKMSEVHAALGLAQLNHIDTAIQRRSNVAAFYRAHLCEVPGIEMPPLGTQWKGNDGYFPIFVRDDFPFSRDELYELLCSRNIFTRRYFYPLISEFPMYRHLPSARAEHLPVASRAAREVLCLPIYPTITDDALDEVVRAIRQAAGDE